VLPVVSSDEAQPKRPGAWHLLRQRLGEVFSEGSGWYVAALGWAAFVGLGLTVFAYRAFAHCSLARMIEFEDVPFLAFMNDAFGLVAWITILLGVALSGLAWVWRGSRPSSTIRGIALAVAVLATALMAWNVTYSMGSSPEVRPTGVGDWLWLLAALGGAWVFLQLRSERARDEVLALPHHEEPLPWWQGLAGLYVIGLVACTVIAGVEHLELWDPTRNGGYRYERFLLPGERPIADLVLFSSSLLFGTLAAATACLMCLGFRATRRRERDDRWAPLRRRVLLATLAIALTLTLPWLLKVSVEIRAEESIVFPLTTIGVALSAALPLVFTCAVLLERDLDEAGIDHEQLSAAERLLLALLLFPVYPILRLVRTSARWPTLSRVALGAYGLTLLFATLVVAHQLDDLYEFEDWRGMLKSGLFPALRVALSLVTAGAVYLVIARLTRRARAALPRVALAAAILIHLAAAVGLALASWPFWGWERTPGNVHTRLIEFSDRHEFERRFLYWLFDFDRDTYAGLLRGGDPADSDASIQGSGLPALAEVALPIDRFEVVDRQAALAFPNLVVLTLEGVTPRSITAYGLRDSLGRSATPYLDELANRGAKMTRAYCAYPSTWDGWFMVTSGRSLSIQEFTSNQPFGDRYSRHNNVHKLMKAVGVERFCYPDANPYLKLFVPLEDREDTWETDFDADPQGDGVTKGDARIDRVVRFIESLQPGERFYLGEHMVDTHFPWHGVSLGRAKELGYEDGMTWAGSDAYVDGEWLSRLSRYYQQITRMDTQVGRVVNALKAKGVLENTLIVIVSDHGCQWYEHEHGYYVSHLYQQSLHIPFIAAGPGVKPGRVIELPTMQVDLVPTLAELAGAVLVDPSHPLEGQSLLALWGGAPPDDATRRRLTQRDILLKTHYDTLGVLEAFRYKLIVDRPTGVRWLFDLEEDPGELKNLIDSHPKVEARLEKRLQELVRERMVFLGGIKRSGEPSD
jgi:hypothetical protein